MRIMNAAEEDRHDRGRHQRPRTAGAVDHLRIALHAEQHDAADDVERRPARIARAATIVTPSGRFGPNWSDMATPWFEARMPRHGPLARP